MLNNMKKIIFITGAARSGKSKLAVDLARGISDKVVFLATCKPEDTEMKERVRLHKKNRPCSWKTIEEDGNIASVLQKINSNYKVVIIDCLTLFISNLLLEGRKDKEIDNKIKKIGKIITKAPYTTIIVSNEVGSGIVPENKIARRFRDIAGIANQTIAKYADTVYFVVSGIALQMKGDGYGKVKRNSK